MSFFVLLIILSWFLWRKSTEGLGQWDLPIGLGIKMAFSFLFVSVYSAYYGDGILTSDINVFMWESGLLSDVASHSIKDYFSFLFGFEDYSLIQQYLSKTDHWTSGDLALINDAQNVMRVNSLLYFVSRGNVFFHLLFFAAVLLLCTRELYLGLRPWVVLNDRLLWYGLLLFPSVAFWSGSILKEPLMMSGLFLFVSALMRTLKWQQRAWRLLLGSLLMLMFKPYVFFLLLIAVVPYLILKLIFPVRAWQAILITIGLGLIGAWLLPNERDKAVHFLWRKQYDFDNVSRGGLHILADSTFYYVETEQYQNFTFIDDKFVILNKPIHAKRMRLGMEYPFEDVLLADTGKVWINYYSTNKCGSYIPTTFINDSPVQLIKNIPEALINSAIRPWPTDPGGKLKWFNILETFGLFTWMIYGLLKYRKQRNRNQNDLIILTVYFAILLFLLIGWTTPVLGAIARYRIPAYLGLFVIGMIGTKEKEL
jgi:hypothetical protein